MYRGVSSWGHTAGHTVREGGKVANVPKYLTGTLLKRQKIADLTGMADAGCTGPRARLPMSHVSRREAFYSWLLDNETVQGNPWQAQKKMKVGESSVSAEEFFLKGKAIAAALEQFDGRKSND